MKVKQMSVILYVFTAVASYLFFTIQLASSKIITPIFGGIAWVWILTMLFYQAVLLGGYFIAGNLSNKPVKYVLAALGSVMIISSFMVPSPEKWGMNLETFGMLQVLQILAASVALSGLALSSSTIILQKSAHSAEISPWQLYFYSNVGSLSAILLYPFFIENVFPVTIFIKIWSNLLLVLGSSVILMSLFTDRKLIYASGNEAGKKLLKPKLNQKIIWLLYSAVPSAFLAVISAFLTEDIASMPFLWAMPLGVFMFAFALPFAPRPFLTYKYNIFYFISGIFVSVLMRYFLLSRDAAIASKFLSVIISLFTLFFITWIYVSGLVRNKPEPEYLEKFYIHIAIGGFLGTFLVSVISPLIFDSYTERWIVTILSIAFPVAVFLSKDKKIWMFEKNSSIRVYFCIIAAFSAFMLGTYSNGIDDEGVYITLYRARSMYGSVRVTERAAGDKKSRILYNGNTMHGYQVYENGELSFKIIPGYYAVDTGCPVPFILQEIYNQRKKQEEKTQVAVVGLGAGVLNFYNKEGSEFTYFEIDNNVSEFAKKYFNYLNIEGSEYSIETGDGRLLLERKNEKKYDIVVIDAFTGVSIPRHLLTKEAMSIYADKIKENGYIAIHTTNRYLNVSEIVNQSVYANNLNCYLIANKYNEWVVATKKKLELSNDSMLSVLKEYAETEENRKYLWTDDFTPLLPYMKK